MTNELHPQLIEEHGSSVEWILSLDGPNPEAENAINFYGDKQGAMVALAVVQCAKSEGKPLTRADVRNAMSCPNWGRHGGLNSVGIVGACNVCPHCILRLAADWDEQAL